MSNEQVTVAGSWALLREAHMFGQFASDANWPLVQTVRSAIRAVLESKASSLETLHEVSRQALSAAEAAGHPDGGSEACQEARTAAAKLHAAIDSLAAAPSIPESDLLALLPGSYYMDPPDGGSVTVLEQLQRMAQDAALYRAAQPHALSRNSRNLAVQALAGEIVAALIADEKDGGFDLTAGMFGSAFSALVRRWADAELSTQAAQPETNQATDAVAQLTTANAKQRELIEQMLDALEFSKDAFTRIGIGWGVSTSAELLVDLALTAAKEHLK